MNLAKCVASDGPYSRFFPPPSCTRARSLELGGVAEVGLSLAEVMTYHISPSFHAVIYDSLGLSDTKRHSIVEPRSQRPGEICVIEARIGVCRDMKGSDIRRLIVLSLMV